MSSTGRRPNWKEKHRRKQTSKGCTTYWLRSVPAWYKRMLNRSVKARNRAELQKLRLDESDENTTFEPFRRDAHWTWW